MEISPRQFHLGKIGHALSKFSIPVGKNHLPKGKMARRVVAPIVKDEKKDYWPFTMFSTLLAEILFVYRTFQFHFWFWDEEIHNN